MALKDIVYALQHLKWWDDEKGISMGKMPNTANLQPRLSTRQALLLSTAVAKGLTNCRKSISSFIALRF